jgi:hypothetical protein
MLTECIVLTSKHAACPTVLNHHVCKQADAQECAKEAEVAHVVIVVQVADSCLHGLGGCRRSHGAAHGGCTFRRDPSVCAKLTARIDLPIADGGDSARALAAWHCAPDTSSGNGHASTVVNNSSNASFELASGRCTP